MSTQRASIAVLAVLALTLVAGCTYPQGEEVSISFHGEINTTDSAVEIDGYLHAGGGIPDREAFEDVYVILYDKNEDRLLSKRIGDLEAQGGRPDINISVSIQPYYVTVESEDFWGENVQVEYFVRCGDEYCPEYATERSELPGNGFDLDTASEEIRYNGTVVDRTRLEWSIMRSGPPDSMYYSNSTVPIFVFSIEEMSTIDFDDVPSREEKE